jgi:antitoxin MazE
VQIAKWGNSLAIRLPNALVKKMNLAEGDEVRLTPSGERNLTLARKPTKDEIIEALRAFEGRAPVGFKFNREEANER